MVGAKLKSLYEERAKERQRAAGGDRKSYEATVTKELGSVVENLPPPSDFGKSRDKAIEEVMALAELIDASLLLEFGDDYSGIGNVDEPKCRVRALLMKLAADDANKTDYFMNKFIHKVRAIFAGLPKPKDWQSFQKNDLPLLFTHDEVQRFALENRLNIDPEKIARKVRGGFTHIPRQRKEGYGGSRSRGHELHRDPKK